jgi:hypothetical protein
MLAASDLALEDASLLLSYPLHPLRKWDRMRTEHFSKLRTPALVVHGAHKPRGSLAEME